MKTPEKWHDIMGYASTCPKLTKHRMDVIDRIQTDAIAEGMRVAAEIVKDRFDTLENTKKQANIFDLSDCAIMILKEAEQLKENETTNCNNPT